jgi:hypothetical protein
MTWSRNKVTHLPNLARTHALACFGKNSLQVSFLGQAIVGLQSFPEVKAIAAIDGIHHFSVRLEVVVRDPRHVQEMRERIASDGRAAPETTTQPRGAGSVN